ncbi:putative iron-sulfur cluster-binding metallochaperone [Methylomarinum vadi]|uniref:putative iron-sulfur cluster-binding metallochaperone n=1 Tax=Methylomarinum vadi TaxID=438855 RepID=UPI0009FFF7A0|nr:hypothetical protein [Methylomarinum vadi]
MSDCCPKTSAKTKRVCPECGSTCIKVGMATLYHQVRFPENQHIAVGDYYFCSSTQCPVAYFSVAGETVPKQRLRTYQEMQNGKLCYCFDIDAEQYLSALRANRGAQIKDFVVRRTQLGDCACDIRNPSGQCCLARFKRLENA